MLRQYLLLFFLVCIISGCHNAPLDSTANKTMESKQTNPNPVAKQTQAETYSVLLSGTKVGQMIIKKNDNQINIDYGYKNNGRGPSSQETLHLNHNGVPTKWTINGFTTFGNETDESFIGKDKRANWQAAAGTGSANFTDQSVYIAQNSSPYATYIYAKALLNNDLRPLPALPSGQLNLKRIQAISLKHDSEKDTQGIVYALSGINLDPSYLVVDKNNQFLGVMSPRFALLKSGLETNEERLRNLAAELNAQRFEDIAKRVTHKYNHPVRIFNVRLFDPFTLSLTDKKSVVVNNKKIITVGTSDARSQNKEILIDGNGGTLIPGLYEMHGHMSDNDALLNVMAGVTSVRDMGNEINVLEPLIEKIENNTLIGPRITKSAFIEGKSEFSNSTGELASSEAEAVQLIKDYAKRGGYHQIKIYSSVSGEWVPAMAAEARKHGMRVAGHIPAFSTVDEMIAAGYNEITHINQAMLSWVLTREEDTRTLFRITGMKRFVDLDLNSDKVQTTINAMLENNIAIDPTNAIHELAMTGRNGVIRAGARDYIDNMPIGVQRGAKAAMLNVADVEEDQAYLKAYEKIIETLAMMHKRGIFIVAGTDLGGGFELHRELELFQKFGMSPAEVLKRASYDMAEYLGHSDLGSIEEGKLADFFLVPGNPIEDLKAIKTISLVSRGGDFYFPSEVYPEFGIKPFTAKPTIKESNN